MMRPVFRHRPMWLLLWMGLSFALPTTVTAQPAPVPAPLVFGMLPFASHVSLFKRFAPLRDYLSQELGREVVLESASDFPTFLQRTHQRRYDLLLTAPHFALAELDDGHYQAIATYLKPLAAIFLVRRDSPLQQLEQLGGNRIATPPTEAIITLAGKHFLDNLGLNHDRAPRYQAFRSHNAAYQAVIGGEAEAAVISPSFLDIIHKQQLPLRVLGKSPDFPSMAILVAADLAPALRRQITDILVGMHEDPEGKRILKKMSYPGYRPVRAGEFDSVRPYLAFLPSYPGGR